MPGHSQTTLIPWLGVLTKVYGASVGVVGSLAMLAIIFVGKTSPGIAVAVTTLWGAIVSAFVLTFLFGQARKGAVLLDLGHPGLKTVLNLLSAVFVLAFGFLGWFTSGILAFALWGIATAVWLAILGFHRLQICENGIWLGGMLLRWNELQSYRWKLNVETQLMLQTKYHTSFVGPFLISSDHNNAVCKLLEQHGIQKAEG